MYIGLWHVSWGYSLCTNVEHSAFEFYQIQKLLHDFIQLQGFNKTSNTRECIAVFKGMYIHHQRDVEADSVNHGIAGISISAEQSID